MKHCPLSIPARSLNALFIADTRFQKLKSTYTEIRKWSLSIAVACRIPRSFPSAQLSQRTAGFFQIEACPPPCCSLPIRPKSARADFALSCTPQRPFPLRTKCPAKRRANFGQMNSPCGCSPCKVEDPRPERRPPLMAAACALLPLCANLLLWTISVIPIQVTLPVSVSGIHQRKKQKTQPGSRQTNVG